MSPTFLQQQCAIHFPRATKSRITAELTPCVCILDASTQHSPRGQEKDFEKYCFKYWDLPLPPGLSLPHSPRPEDLTPAPHSSAIALVYTIALTHLDHCTNLTQSPILIVASFPIILHSVAAEISQNYKSNYVPLLRASQWFPVALRINHKILLLFYETLYILTLPASPDRSVPPAHLPPHSSCTTWLFFLPVFPTTDPLHQQFSLARALCSLKDPAGSFLTFRSQLQCHVLGEPLLTSPSPRYRSHYCFPLVQLSSFMPHLLLWVVCSFLLDPSVIWLGCIRARTDLPCSLYVSIQRVSLDTVNE